MTRGWRIGSAVLTSRRAAGYAIGGCGAGRASPNVTRDHRRRQRVTLGPHTSPNVARSPAGEIDVTLGLARSEHAGRTPHTATATRARRIATSPHHPNPNDQPHCTVTM